MSASLLETRCKNGFLQQLEPTDGRKFRVTGGGKGAKGYFLYILRCRQSGNTRKNVLVTSNWFKLNGSGGTLERFANGSRTRGETRRRPPTGQRGDGWKTRWKEVWWGWNRRGKGDEKLSWKHPAANDKRITRVHRWLLEIHPNVVERGMARCR